MSRRTLFGTGRNETAALSAGMAKPTVLAVLTGGRDNACALSRPPGRHCLPAFSNGFGRVAVLDRDMHHGDGTEPVFYDHDDALSISIHQHSNYPPDSGYNKDHGRGAGLGYNMNIPQPAGPGHTAYLAVMGEIVLLALDRYKPDVIMAACGYDVSAVDPLARMLATAQTFRDMTLRVSDVVERQCDGKLVLVHENGYSEVYVPFCGHATLQA